MNFLAIYAVYSSDEGKSRSTRRGHLAPPPVELRRAHQQNPRPISLPAFVLEHALAAFASCTWPASPTKRTLRRCRPSSARARRRARCNSQAVRKARAGRSSQRPAALQLSRSNVP